MPYTVIVESYREFAERHGNRPLNCGSMNLFADGAMVNPNDDRDRQEPPRGPVELVRVKLRYWREAVRRSTADFETLRSQCSRQAELAARYSNLPGPANGALADLHKLRDAVAFCREKVAELDKELEAKTTDDPGRLRQQACEQYERDEQARAAALLGEIASITI
jgi:hypothetical protein